MTISERIRSHPAPASMNRSPTGPVQSAQQKFSESFAFLVSHRGLSAEQELLDFLGPLRLAELYEGGEPSFSELIEISRVLRVPFSSFLVRSPGGFEDLEVAFAELLYHAAQASDDARAAAGREILDLAQRLAERAEAEAAGEASARSAASASRKDNQS